MWTQKHTGCGRKTERFERHFGNRLGRSERDVLERNVTRYCVATVRKQSAHNGPSQFGKKLQYAAVFNSLSSSHTQEFQRASSTIFLMKSSTQILTIKILFGV